MVDWLHVEGNKIKDSSGAEIRLVGANQMLTNRGNPPTFNPSSYTTIVNAGGNCVRLMVSFRLLSEEKPIPWHSSYEKANVLPVIDEIVKTAKANGLYVFIALSFNRWDTNPITDYQEWMEANNGEHMKQITLELVERYLNEPTVMGINLINEPFDPSEGADLEHWRTLLRNYSQDLASRIHAKNPHLLIFLNNMPYGSHPEMWIGHFLAEPNCLYTYHRYYTFARYWVDDSNWATQYERSNLTLAKDLLENMAHEKLFRDIKNVHNHAVLLAEFGGQEVDPNRLVYVKDQMNIMEKHGIGCMIWDMSNFEPWQMFQEDGQTLNEYGLTWKENIGWTRKAEVVSSFLLPFFVIFAVLLLAFWMSGRKK